MPSPTVVDAGRALDAEVLSLHLHRVEMKLLSPSGQRPFKLADRDMRPTYRILRDGNAAVLHYAFRFLVTDNRHEVAKIAVTYAVVLMAGQDVVLAADDWERLAMLWPLKLVHDELRVYLHELTQAMGLPPLVLDIFQKPSPALT